MNYYIQVNDDQKRFKNKTTITHNKLIKADIKSRLQQKMKQSKLIINFCLTNEPVQCRSSPSSPWPPSFRRNLERRPFRRPENVITILWTILWIIGDVLFQLKQLYTRKNIRWRGDSFNWTLTQMFNIKQNDEFYMRKMKTLKHPWPLR